MKNTLLPKSKVAVLVIDLGGSNRIVGDNTYDGGFNLRKLAKIELLLQYAQVQSLPCYATEYQFSTIEMLIPYIPRENIFQKSDWDAFKWTNLASRLRESHVTHLVPVGFNLDACVLATTRTAVRLDYSVLTSADLMFTGGDCNPYGIEAMNFYKTKTRYFDSGEQLLEAVKLLSEAERN